MCGSTTTGLVDIMDGGNNQGSWRFRLARLIYGRRLKGGNQAHWKAMTCLVHMLQAESGLKEPGMPMTHHG